MMALTVFVIAIVEFILLSKFIISKIDPNDAVEMQYLNFSSSEMNMIRNRFIFVIFMLHFAAFLLIA